MVLDYETATAVSWFPIIVFWCMLFCFVYLPIFGRPTKHQCENRPSDFRDHILALATNGCGNFENRESATVPGWISTSKNSNRQSETQMKSKQFTNQIDNEQSRSSRPQHVEFDCTASCNTRLKIPVINWSPGTDVQVSQMQPPDSKPRHPAAPEPAELEPSNSRTDGCDAAPSFAEPDPTLRQPHSIADVPGNGCITVCFIGKVRSCDGRQGHPDAPTCIRRSLTKFQSCLSARMNWYSALWSHCFSGGHVLIESVPGLGKTLFVRTLGKDSWMRFWPNSVYG